MKKVNVKDVEVTEIEENTKESNVKKIVLLTILGIVSLVGVFFWSTKVRWDAEIEEYTEILYYGQEEIKIDSLVDFYGEEVNTEVDEYSAILMYCESEYGGTCVTGDFNNSFENILREPSIVINIVILIDLILIFLLLKDKCFGKVKTYVIFGIILLYGLVNIGTVAYNFSDYYSFVNDSKNVVDGKIVRQLITNNKKEYYPVVEYSTKQGDFVDYILVPLNGEVTDDLPDKGKITIYYDKNDNSVCTTKQSMSQYILPLIVGISYIVVSIIYLVKSKKIVKS